MKNGSEENVLGDRALGRCEEKQLLWRFAGFANRDAPLPGSTNVRALEGQVQWFTS